MSLRDVLVLVDQGRAAPVRLRMGVDLAGRHGARVTALFVHSPDQEQLNERKTAELGLASAQQVLRLDRATEKTIEGAADELRAELEQLARASGVAVEWRSLSGPLSVIAPQQARYFDLCILGHEARANQVSVDYNFSEHLLFVTGRPVILVPPAWTSAALGRSVAVAWNSSRASTRALNDAMPLLELADRTTLLCMNPAHFLERRGAPPVAHMVDHLRRHDARIHMVSLHSIPHEAIAQTLQAQAQLAGADLLVAGAFGHPRLWEKFLGGVTRDLLEDTRMPLLLAH